MRTTIDIPDSLYKELESKAAIEGSSVKMVILRSVEQILAKSATRRKRIKLPLIHGKETRRINPTNAEIEDLLFS